MCDIHIIADARGDRVFKSAIRVFARELAEYGQVEVRHVARREGTGRAIVLETDSSLPPQSFRIVHESTSLARVIGGDANGVLYGCGRFLRACRFADDGVSFPDNEGPSIPGKSFRGMYFAVHMNNFYHAAPLPVVTRYVEQLALWGLNHLLMYFHMFHFKGMSDPACRDFVARLRAIYDAARGVGMKTGILVTANDGYLNSPEDLRYVGDVPRNWGAEICPNKPGAMDLLRWQFGEVFTAFPEVDYLNIWPYDSGGCLCDACRPWGVNGYYPTAEAVAKVFRDQYPNKQVILSTWMLDYNCGQTGEWDAFYQRLRDGRLDWADLIMADGAYVNGYFPQRVLDDPIGRPVISFTDISMRTGAPWCSFGANPMGAFLETEWDRVKDAINGGTPYSEGVYEDINKFIWSQLCWSPSRPMCDIVVEYCSAEVNARFAAEVADAVMLLEKVGRREPIIPGRNRVILPETSHCQRAWEILERVDRALPRHRRRSWRWRLLLLRAMIDAELVHSGGAPTPVLGRAYDELFEIFHVTDQSLWFCRPYEVELSSTDPAQEYRYVQRGKRIADILHREVAVDEQAMAEA